MARSITREGRIVGVEVFINGLMEFMSRLIKGTGGLDLICSGQSKRFCWLREWYRERGVRRIFCEIENGAKTKTLTIADASGDMVPWERSTRRGRSSGAGIIRSETSWMPCRSESGARRENPFVGFLMRRAERNVSG
jgi:hypothetical protein